MLLQIGEFARLTGLPVRTVRYYGDLGLLPPAEVDPSSGYRRYRVAQVERANRLIALKETGFSLEEIGLILDDQLTPVQFRDLLEQKVAALRTEAELISGQLQRAQAQLDLLARRMEQPMADVTIKTTERKTIAYVRDQIGGTAEIAPMFPKLFSAVDPEDGVGVACNIYHYFADDGSSIDLEAAIPVPDDYAAAAPAATRVIEPVQVASLMFHGAFNRLHEAHAELLAWVETNGYTVSGPAYEWNIVCTPPVTQDNESYITEIQVEVTKTD
ncbi:MAG: MerR family transcriptional regulator [Actinomycetota bacterium]